jgi:hypothetical protein
MLKLSSDMNVVFDPDATASQSHPDLKIDETLPKANLTTESGGNLWASEYERGSFFEVKEKKA